MRKVGLVLSLCSLLLVVSLEGMSFANEKARGIEDLFQGVPGKEDKHIPIIEVPDKVKSGEYFTVTVSVGKKISHPNTTVHHIGWVEVYFLPEGEKYPVQLGRFDFLAHGESVKGPDSSTVYTKPEVILNFTTGKPGTIYASSYCNIHGLWQNSKQIVVE